MKKNHVFFASLIVDAAFALLSLIGFVVFLVIEQGMKTLSITMLSVLIVAILVGVCMLAVNHVTTTLPEEGKVSEEATAICPTCGAENPGDLPYCTHCGSPLK